MTMLYLALKQTTWAQPRVGQWTEEEFSKVRAFTSPGQASWKRASSVKKRNSIFTHCIDQKKENKPKKNPTSFSPAERQFQSLCFLKVKSKNPHSYMSIFPLRNVGYLYWDSSFLKFKICLPPPQ